MKNKKKNPSLKEEKSKTLNSLIEIITWVWKKNNVGFMILSDYIRLGYEKAVVNQDLSKKNIMVVRNLGTLRKQFLIDTDCKCLCL